MIELIFISALGALFNAIRGGQFKLNIPLIGFKDINAVAFGVLCYLITGGLYFAIAMAVAMRLGSTTGWGDYIAALFDRDFKQARRYHLGVVEKRFDRLLEKNRVLWGLLMLSIRGLIWGFLLWLPVAFVYGQSGAILLAGLSMGAAYLVTHSALRLFGTNSADKSWAYSEYVYGALLWLSVGVCI